jgi:peroxiredoxin Q/BCP
MALTTGDRAPAFTLPDQNGDKVKLADLKGRKVLVYFYPKADTPGCTTQSCELRDIKDDVDVQIIGISPDEPAKQKKFDDKYSLGFPLLSDPDHKIADKYGAWGPKKLYGREYDGIIRSAFLVGENGTLIEAWPKISPKDTPKKLLQTLRRIQEQDAS